MKKIAALFFILSVLTPLSARTASAEDAVIASRLKTIENKQDRILQAIEELKSELNMVKIRVTSQ